MDQPREYRIFCLVIGQTTPFPIIIQSDKTVGELKNEIKENKRNYLHGVDASDLRLFKVDLPGLDIDQVLAQIATLSLPSKTMNPLNELMQYYRATPPKETIHVLVQVPIIKATTHRNHRHLGILPQALLSLKREVEEIRETIAEHKPDLQKAITRYLRDDVQLPLFQPQVGSAAAKAHIASLKIPVLPSSSDIPSLLLHNLGQPSHDPGLAGRVNALFRANSKLKFFYNTSGSGKTRVVLEGLWQTWGFYFTAGSQFDGVGSRDVENILYRLELGRLMMITNDNRATALGANRMEASRQFYILLYVRMFVFRVFLECASEMPGGIKESHKGRWLLIQLSPERLLETCDPFFWFAQLFSGASSAYLSAAIQEELVTVRNLLGSKQPDLFCVLDQAEVAMAKFEDYFLSDSEPAQPRPVLCEIIRTWVDILPNLIISGTGISMQEMAPTLDSVVTREGRRAVEIVTDVGAFDNEEIQRAYLERYLPQSFLTTDTGKMVARRVGYWLHGRYQFTTTYVSRLIQTGFQSPHRVLNDFVYVMTNVRPSDCKDDSPLAVKLEKPGGFNFSKLEKDQALLRQMAGFVYEYIFNGNPTSVGSENCAKLVEYDVARFRTSERVLVDEPLALLATLHHFSFNPPWSLQQFLLEGISSSNDIAMGMELEHLCAHQLALAFKSARPLSDIFQFVVPNELKEEFAQLVAIHKVDGGFEYTPADISSDQRGNSILGRSTSTDEETLSWLQDPQRTAFCFPTHMIGPVLILFLELSDESLLRVLVQFKCQKTMSPQETADAYRTTDPNQFVAQLAKPAHNTGVSKNQPGPVRPKETPLKDAQKAEKLLSALGPILADAGEFGVLRVLASFPAKPHEPTLKQSIQDDQSKHPGAILDMSSPAFRTSVVEILQSLEQRMIQVAIQRKRKKEDENIPEVERVDRVLEDERISMGSEDETSETK